MKLAKPAIDVGLSTRRAEAQRDFWKRTVGLPFESELPIAEGHVQLRFDARGSVVKVNCFAQALIPDTPAGYHEVLVEQHGLTEPVALADPDGALVTLVPPGYNGVRQIGIRLRVNDVEAHRRFLADIFGFAAEDNGGLRAGESLILLEQARADDASSVPPGAGWRYITVQVFDADKAHARALTAGASQAKPPVTLGDVARFSIVRDPDGNAIEISQRFSLVGNTV